MSVDYRECMMFHRLMGEKMTFSYSEHCKATVLQQLQECLEVSEIGYEEPYVWEEDMRDDMLWLLRGDEEVEKGIYSWNRPEGDLAIVAPPALMALVMGEYVLAVKLMEKAEVPMWKNKADEFYLEDARVNIGGGSYTFGEACLMSGEMPVSVKQYFREKGYYDILKLKTDGNSMLFEMQFHRTGQSVLEDVWRPIQEVKNLCESDEMGGKGRELLPFAIEYALGLKIDKKCDDFWDKLFQMFPEREEQFIIAEAMHAYFLNLCSAENLSPRYEERLLDGLQAYFRYEPGIPMTGAVEDYVLERMETKSYRSGKWKKYLDRYFNTVKRFDGSVSKKWQLGMFELLSCEDVEWIQTGFYNGFLKKDCIAEYIEYLLQKHIREGKNYTAFIPQLIQMQWQENENA